MKNLEDHKKIAVLIDADNAQYSKLKVILNELSAHGHLVVKKAYGDWSCDTLKNWKTALNELAIQPVQQFAYTTGKNSTDASMIIDAMDLLYTKQFDAFALVSSDSDFTRLAARLRESEVFVFGVGEEKTPVSFRNACDDFILTENLGKVVAVVAAPEAPAAKKPVAVKPVRDEVLELIINAWELTKDDDGYANLGGVGNVMKRQKPDFDPRTYGAQKLSELIDRYPKVISKKKVSYEKGGTGYSIKVSR
jgi:uncharacterized protein (TIGR00288 family)